MDNATLQSFFIFAEPPSASGLGLSYPICSQTLLFPYLENLTAKPFLYHKQRNPRCVYALFAYIHGWLKQYKYPANVFSYGNNTNG